MSLTLPVAPSRLGRFGNVLVVTRESFFLAMQSQKLSVSPQDPLSDASGRRGS
jgi:hypothetical protein